MYYKIKKILALFLITIFMYGCGDNTAIEETLLPGNNTEETVPTALYTQNYKCSDTVSLPDSCSSLDLHQTDNNTYLDVTKILSGVSKRSLYMYADGNFEAFQIIPDIASTERVIYDNKTDNIILHTVSEAGITSFISVDINKTATPIQVSYNAISIPTTEISGFIPVLAHNNILYGMGMRSSDNGIFFYEVDYNDAANVTVSLISGLHNGTTTVSNWTQSIVGQLRYAIKYAQVVGDILYYSPRATTDIDGDGSIEGSQLYWVNLGDHSVGGYFNPVPSVNISRVYTYNNEVYFRYESLSFYKWYKSSIIGSGNTATATYTQMLDWQNSLYALLPTSTQIYADQIASDLIGGYGISVLDTNTFIPNTIRYTRSFIDGYNVVGQSSYLHGVAQDGLIDTPEKWITINGVIYMHGYIATSPYNYGIFKVELTNQ